jgi:methyl acetate hydrolase
VSIGAGQRLGADPISSVLAQFVDNRAVPGVLGVVTDVDRIVYTGAYGAAQRRNGIAMSSDTVFRIASMTKLVTSVAILMLVDEGSVELDAPLARYVPGFRQPEVLVSFDMRTKSYTTRPAQSEITVRQLLTHTSGYGYWFLDRHLFALTDPAALDLLNAPFLIDEPGASFNYSTSTDVVGQLIEPVSGAPLERFLAQRVFRPLGMRNTSYTPPKDATRLASLFARSSDGVIELALETSGQAPRGGGGLYSTADDYCRLLRMILNRGMGHDGRLLSEGAWAQLTGNQIGDLRAPVQTSAFTERSNDFIFMNGTQKFGLGLALESRDQPGGRPIGSASWAGIYNTYFWIDFENEFAAALFMQVQPFADIHCVEVCRRFESAIYDCLSDAD